MKNIFKNNQIKINRTLDSESIGNQSGGVRQREPLMDGPHPKVVESFKDV